MMNDEELTKENLIPFLEESTIESLRNFFYCTNVLIEQKIIRSSKYSADIAEHLCAKLFDLTLCKSQREVGYDALDSQGKKIQIKINNSSKKTNQEVGEKTLYDYLYLVITRNSLLFNTDYKDAFLLFYILRSEDIPGDKYIAKRIILTLAPAMALSERFEAI